MYKKFYWYRSGVTNTMKNALKDIFLTVKKMSILNKGDTILDIGANDGTFLKYFKREKYITIGCEPAKNLTKFLKKKFGGDEIEKGERIFLKDSKEIYTGKEIGELAEECDAKFNTESVISIELNDATQDELKKWGFPDSKLLPIPGK